MSSSASPTQPQPQHDGSRLRNIFLGSLFALVLFVPKITHLRHNPRLWVFFRIFFGVAGAALVLVPLVSGNNFVLPIVSLVLFVSAILLPPAKLQITVEEKSRELGALSSSMAVASGPQMLLHRLRFSFLSAPNASPSSMLTFSLSLEIPAGEITSARAEQTEKGWLLEVAWSTHVADSPTAVFSPSASLTSPKPPCTPSCALPSPPSRNAAPPAPEHSRWNSPTS